MGTKRQQQAQQTRQKIVDAAQKLIGERGYANVTIADIAKECGIAMGTMYHYFATKDDLMRHFERGRYVEIRNRVDSMDLSSAEEKIACFIREWFALVQGDNINLSKYWHHLAVDMNLPIDNERTHLEDDIDVLVHYMEEGIASGEFSEEMPVRVIATDIMFSVYGASFFRCSAYKPFNLVEWSGDFEKHALHLHLRPFLKNKA